MSPNCIRTSSAEFQQLAKDLNVSEHSLELLAHEYNMLKQDQNGTAYLSSEGRSWLNNRLNGTSQEALPNTVQLWKDNYSKPQVFTNAKDANAAYSDAVSYFGSQATVFKETYDGKYELKVAEPVVVTRDTNSNLLAPNGEKSKLSLQQYIQVRTKAFMDWFGDWINDPENASKVVDPVTKEPMVVYRGSQIGIQNDSKLYMYFSNSRGDASIYAQGQFTKGGQLFVNNQNIKNGIIQYIKDKYGIKHRPDMDTMLDLLENRDSKGKLLGRQNTEEENKYIEFAQKYFEHKIQDKKLYDFVEMFELINDTTLSSEYDLFKQYDDTNYIHNKSKLDKLFDVYKDDIAKFKNNKSGIVDNVFLNIRTPYMEEIHSEDLLDNSSAYKHGHDGAFLLEGEHFLVKKGSQIKSATANVGTFSSTSDNIYEHRSNIQQALGIVERAEKALLAAKTEQETKAVEARFNAYLAEVLSPEIKVVGGNFGLRNGGNTTNLNLLRDVAELEKSATPEELNTLFITLSKKFVALDGTPKPFRITYGNGLHIVDRGSYYEVQVNNNQLPSYTQLAEEMLHPLVENIQRGNPELFSNFLKEVQTTRDRKLKVIRDGIYRAYSDKSISEQNNELVTQALAYEMKKADQSKLSKAAKSIINAIVKWLVDHNIFKAAPARMKIEHLAYALKFENVKVSLANMLRTYEHRESIPTVETHEGYWTRAEVEKATDKVFLFGDNTEDRTVTHYVPSFTQAVIRGLPNTIGIDTKKDRRTSESSYFTDADFDQFKAQVDEAIQKAIDSGKTIVLPADGIGTGKAQLKERAPKLFNYLQEKLAQLSDSQQAADTFNPTSTQTESSTPKVVQEVNERAERVRKFLADQQRFYNEIKAIQDSGRLSNMEVRKVAADVAYAVSDLITQVQNGEIDINQLVPGKQTKKPIAEMSRAEILQFIGVYTPGETFDTDSGAFAYVRRTYFGDLSKMKGTGTELRANRKAAVTINQNFRAIVELAAEEMVNVEGFGLRLAEERPAEVIEGMNINVDDFNNEEDPMAVLEREGDLQEHWQINFRTLDVLGSMSQIVRQALLQCYKLDTNGNPIESRFGIKERVSAREATSQILRWTQGAIDMQSMIAKLKENEERNPWIKQIIQRLTNENKSDAEYGADTDFRSQFYSVFNKHFQMYTSIVEDTDNKYYSATSNERPVLKGIIDELQAAIATDQVPMFQGGRVTEYMLASFKKNIAALPVITIEEQFQVLTEEQAEDAQNNIWAALKELGIVVTDEQLQDGWNYKSYRTIRDALQHISEILTKHLQDETYDPLAFKEGIRGNLKLALEPLISNLEDVAVSSFYDNGKTYQSYVTPSYLTKFLQKMRLQGEEFYTFIENEFGQYDWFKDSEGNWRNPWIADIVRGHEKSGQKCGNIPYSELFAHKVELNFDKHGYMREMSPAEYTLSLLAEFFTSSDSKDSVVPAWYRVTMLSNKPSSEFIRFKRYADLSTYRESILNDIMKVFAQELGRIKTTKARNELYKKGSQEYIKNLDKNGRKFNFLPYLNSVEGRFKELLDRKTLPNGEGLTIEEEAELNKLARQEISKHLSQRSKEILDKWEKNGVIEAATKIKGLNKNNVRAQLENFIWNDNLASMMIDEIFITDRALYKNTEDLQKRMAQIHAPGVRGDVNAVDYDGHKVSADGIYRAVLLKDFDGFVSNVIDNLTEVFERREQGLTGSELDAAKALHSSIIEQYKKINVADAQAYSCLTSRRKKDFIMGQWSRAKESLYKKIMARDFSDATLSTMFAITNACEPAKPFCYSQIKKSTNVSNGMSNYKLGVQYKNSEYLLIMADAILQSEKTTKPNLLRAINNFMQESASRADGRGIDTVQFESAAKGLNQGAIDIAQFLNVEGGEALALKALRDAAYSNAEMTQYNPSVVNELPFEDWCIQQPVPNHFYSHAQQQGSQGRMIVISDLADTFNGEEVKYNIYGDEYTSREVRKEFEDNIAQNIEASINNLTEELGLDYLDSKERNIAIAEILQREIKSSSRYGTDLLKACTLNAEGEFIIPLTDPIQSKRIEQLLNSIIKNRVNKQEIAGGPVVQVSNFGTAEDLNIRYFDKNGKLLPTKAEFALEAKKRGIAESAVDKAYKDFCHQNQGDLAYYEVYVSRFEGIEKYEDKNGNVDMERIKKECSEILDLICSRIPTEDKYSMIPCRIKGFLPKFAGAGIMMPADITTQTGCDFDVDKMYVMRKQFIKDENGNYVFPHDKTTTIGRNNRTVETMRVILTHASNLDKLFNPGGFEPQKRTGYMVQAYKQGAAEWSVLQDIADLKTQIVEQEDGAYDFQTYNAKMVDSGEALGGIDALKALSYKASDISFVDTQIQFYEQNSAAASILGIFAVAKVAHATLENNKFRLVLNGGGELGVGLMHPVTIGSLRLGIENNMTVEIDPTKNTLGQYIGKDLGSLVASAADAVKDPVLNLMNINKETVNVLNTLIRLGMPFEEAALFLSQQVITEVIQQYYKERINKGITLLDVIKKRIAEFKDMGDADRIELTKDDLVNGLKSTSDAKRTFQTLYMFDRVLRMSNALSGMNFLTRFNSIANAVGPLVIDNIMKENKLEDYHYSQIQIDNISSGESKDIRYIQNKVFSMHPVLKGFSQTLGVAKRVFAESPEYKGLFNTTLRERNIGLERIVTGNRDTLNKYADFFKSSMLVSNGTIDTKETDYFVNSYARDFLAIKRNEKYKDNLLVQAIRVAKDKAGSLYLKVDNGVLNDETLKGNLSASWADLLKLDEKVAFDLFKYCFFRGGIGFTPRTFMNLVPLEIKEAFPGYIETYRNGDLQYLPNLGRMFVQNNWRNNRIAPTRELKSDKGKNLYTLHTGGILEVNSDICNIPYFKMQDAEKNFHLYEKVDRGNAPEINEYREIPILGGNGDFIDFYTNDRHKPVQKVAIDAANKVPTDTSDATTIQADMTEVDTEVSNYSLEFTRNSQEYIDSQRAVEGLNLLGYTTQAETVNSVKQGAINAIKEKGVEVKAEDVTKTIEDKNPC